MKSKIKVTIVKGAKPKKIKAKEKRKMCAIETDLFAPEGLPSGETFVSRGIWRHLRIDCTSERIVYASDPHPDIFYALSLLTEKDLEMAPYIHSRIISRMALFNKMDCIKTVVWNFKSAPPIDVSAELSFLIAALAQNFTVEEITVRFYFSAEVDYFCPIVENLPDICFFRSVRFDFQKRRLDGGYFPEFSDPQALGLKESDLEENPCQRKLQAIIVKRVEKNSRASRCAN